ncbi:hypothetical protein O181_046284 [Austropuccinia psidii MF-1]|uniref:Uncharacterized protein n=1 Tax=Austropuccinia psidii MF-1 TaxID=1389203 RepID=A0A9Q3DNM0_9BASI|nr:hypothetical protein [Austropuccinia psidii MF-1]
MVALTCWTVPHSIPLQLLLCHRLRQLPGFHSARNHPPHWSHDRLGRSPTLEDSTHPKFLISSHLLPQIHQSVIDKVVFGIFLIKSLRLLSIKLSILSLEQALYAWLRSQAPFKSSLKRSSGF